MNKPLRLSCREAMDEIYEFSEEDAVPLLQKFRVAFHLFFCTHCAGELRKLQIIQELMQADFFPPAPSFEEKVMGELNLEFHQDEISEEPIFEVPGGFSFRSWVIIGFIILVSLATSFFGTDLIEAAANQDPSLMIPLGITVGTVLTGYGAFFIASHLKELSEHFKILR